MQKIKAWWGCHSIFSIRMFPPTDSQRISIKFLNAKSNLLSNRYRVPPCIKRLGPEADYSPLFSAEGKNEWSYITTPKHVFTSRCLTKNRYNFTFPLTTASKFCFVSFQSIIIANKNSSITSVLTLRPHIYNRP